MSGNRKEIKLKMKKKIIICIAFLLIAITICIPASHIYGLYYEENYVIVNKHDSIIVLFQGEYYYPITNLSENMQREYENHIPVTYQEYEDYTIDYTGVNTDKILSFYPELITAVYKDKDKTGSPYFIMLNHDIDYCFYNSSNCLS